MTGGKLTWKIFKTFGEALRFSVDGVGYGQCGEIIKVDYERNMGREISS